MKSTILTIFLCILSIQISNAQWVQASNGMDNRDVSKMASGGITIYAGTSNGGVYLSTNNGVSWTQTTLNNRYVTSLVVNGNNIFAGTFGNGVYLSTNNGASWVQTSLSYGVVSSLAISVNNIFAGASLTGVYLSTDNGTSWTQTSLNNRNTYSLAVNGNTIFAGTYNASPFGIYLTTDNGTTWSQTSLNNQNVYSLTVNGNNIFAGTQAPGNGVYLSTDNGTSWTQTSLNNGNVYSLTSTGNNIFATTGANGVYMTTDNGGNWAQINEGLNATAGAISILNNYIFIGTSGTSGSVWRRPLSEITGIHTSLNDIPSKLSLWQNYPNPFNPTTKIKFSLPNSSFTKLVIYDNLGREIGTVVNEQLNAGTYEANWNASNFSSGVYFYKLTAGNYSETKKMLLVK